MSRTNSEKALPWFKFHPSRWRSAALSQVSRIARSVYVDVMCIAHDSPVYGHIMIGSRALDAGQIATAIGASLEETETSLRELEAWDIIQRNGAGVIYCPWLIHDREEFLTAQQNGRKGGMPAQKDQVQAQVQIRAQDQVSGQPASGDGEGGVKPTPNPGVEGGVGGGVYLDKEKDREKEKENHLPSEEALRPSDNADLFGEPSEPAKKVDPISTIPQATWDHLRDIIGTDDRGELIKMARKFLGWSGQDVALMAEAALRTHVRLPHKKPLGIYQTTVAGLVGQKKAAQSGPTHLRLVKGGEAPKPAVDQNDPFGIQEWCRGVPGVKPTSPTEREWGLWKNEHGILDYWANQVIDAAGFRADWQGVRKGNLSLMLDWMALDLDPNEVANTIRRITEKKEPGTIVSLRFFDSEVRRLRSAA